MVKKNNNTFDLSEEYFLNRHQSSKHSDMVSKKINTGKDRTTLSVTVVILFGIVILGYGGYVIKERVVSPFKGNLLPEQLALVTVQTEQDKEDELREKDTDEDGLSDYEEVYFYNTSPYLADTDSDGISDSEEIEKGENPNCARGTDCVGIRLVTSDTTISDLFPQFSTSDITLKDKTIGDFRQILLAQGYDADELAEVSDEALLVILEEALKYQAEIATTTPSNEKISYDDVRLFLIELGVPEAEVFSLSNSEVEQILRTLQ